MALRQVNAGIFPYFEHLELKASEGTGTVIYEFDQSVALHNLSISAASEVEIDVQIIYPLSFSSSLESRAVSILSVSSGTPASEAFLSPFAVTSTPAGNAPLPSVLPKGALLQVFCGNGQVTDVDVQIFLTASSLGHSEYRGY